MNFKKGYTQIYTGNGKGKTTAAIGQAVRAAGFGLRTYMIQFMKEYPYNEIKSLKSLSKFITVEQCGKDDFVYKKELPSEEEKEKVKNGLTSGLEKMKSKKYNIIILDEALVSIYFKLLTEEDILDFINKKPHNIELIITGRYAPQSIINAADLVTEMKEIKHYYLKGVPARKGIES